MDCHKTAAVGTESKSECTLEILGYSRHSPDKFILSSTLCRKIFPYRAFWETTDNLSGSSLELETKTAGQECLEEEAVTVLTCCFDSHSFTLDSVPEEERRGNLLDAEDENKGEYLVFLTMMQTTVIVAMRMIAMHIGTMMTISWISLLCASSTSIAFLKRLVSAFSSSVGVVWTTCLSPGTKSRRSGCIKQTHG